jgi:hypothetical protein
MPHYYRLPGVGASKKQANTGGGRKIVSRAVFV